MRRREFIAGLGGAAAWPMVARAQEDKRLRHIGVLMSFSQGDPTGSAEAIALRQGLMELGWIEGRNIDIEFRWPGGDLERIQTFARELARRQPDVLVGRSSPAVAALKREAATIPIIFVAVVEPVEQGFVQSLARPGGNITGLTNIDASIAGKWFQLLKEIAPRIEWASVIYKPQSAPSYELFLRSVQSAALMFSASVIAAPCSQRCRHRSCADDVYTTAIGGTDCCARQLPGGASRTYYSAGGAKPCAGDLWGTPLC
jgi:putative ABC transport system substrate-binding protein